MEDHLKEYRKLHRQLFPTVKSMTSEQAEAVIRQFHKLHVDDRRTVISMMMGTFTARVTSPSKSYNIAGRHFFNEMKKAMEELKPIQIT